MPKPQPAEARRELHRLTGTVLTFCARMSYDDFEAEHVWNDEGLECVNCGMRYRELDLLATQVRFAADAALAQARAEGAAEGRADVEWLVDFIKDHIYIESDGAPDHRCGFTLAPDTGYCEVHDKWFLILERMAAAAATPSDEWCYGCDKRFADCPHGKEDQRHAE